MNKKFAVLAAVVCAEMLMLIHQNQKLNQTIEVVLSTSDLVETLADREAQRTADTVFENIVENYED